LSAVALAKVEAPVSAIKSKVKSQKSEVRRKALERQPDEATADGRMPTAVF
jgi:hypothetical protein